MDNNEAVIGQSKRYFRIRDRKDIDEDTFEDYINNSSSLSLINVTISDVIKKKIIHEYPAKQGFVDLSYYFDDVNIYENREITVTINIFGSGKTEVERESDAYLKVQQLNKLLLDLNKEIEIEISKYPGYFFRGKPVFMKIEEKEEESILGILKVTYIFLVFPEAAVKLEGHFPINQFCKGKHASFLHTDIRNDRNFIYFYLDKKAAVTVYTVINNTDNIPGNYTIKVNNFTQIEITEYKYSGNRRFFTIDSLYLNEKENVIVFEKKDKAKALDDHFIILEKRVI
ncbi:hypothetical protein AZF37_09730 (plasmid) [endosymbiont 'TC1' of Trimyema compressum]|uniref:hypothetical protein n=1 Tax=endosymbiont 'TC1' of Trimyema compressum TaxID=243899 RepID=UPI0007F0FD78|nr:hypothetical protein [endosymbiont 'TC1' of Trimyema compressum]AMP21453.1 hypothetical protein AZF37_09730 [endosymbiont 'TC1' of Trimyema compressum]